MQEKVKKREIDNIFSLKICTFRKKTVLLQPILVCALARAHVLTIFIDAGMGGIGVFPPQPVVAPPSLFPGMQDTGLCHGGTRLSGRSNAVQRTPLPARRQGDILSIQGDFLSILLCIYKKKCTFAADFGMRTRARSCANNYLL